MKRPWDYLVEADERGRAIERAWREAPGDPEAYAAYLAAISRGMINNDVDLNDITPGLAASSIVREALSHVPLKKLVYSSSGILSGMYRPAEKLLIRKRVLLGRRGFEALYDDHVHNTTRKYVTVNYVLYKPSDAKNRFIVVATGARQRKGRAEAIHCITGFDNRFWTSTSTKLGDNFYYYSLDGDPSLSRFDIGKKAIIVYRRLNGSFLKSHIAAGN